MIIKHDQEIIQNYDGDSSKTAIFSSYIDSYVSIIPEVKAEQLIKPQNLEDVLDTEFLTNIEITEDQLDRDIAMCRNFEGEE